MPLERNTVTKNASASFEKYDFLCIIAKQYIDSTRIC